MRPSPAISVVVLRTEIQKPQLNFSNLKSVFCVCILLVTIKCNLSRKLTDKFSYEIVCKQFFRVIALLLMSSKWRIRMLSQPNNYRR